MIDRFKHYIKSLNKSIKTLNKKTIKRILTIQTGDVKRFMVKYRSVLILVFMIVYVLFWVWFFGERNVAVTHTDLNIGNSKVNKHTTVDSEVVRNKEEHEEKKEFSKEQLGNFWLEINTEDVKVKAPIVNGIEDDDLKKGLGRHKTMAMPGENGNLVISGHRWKVGSNPSYKVFEDLDKLKNGDKILVHYDNKVFEYEIYDDGVVKPNEKGTEEILKRTSEPILTLYTCTPKYTSFKRLYYRAKLKR